MYSCLGASLPWPTHPTIHLQNKNFLTQFCDLATEKLFIKLYNTRANNNSWCENLEYVQEILLDYYDVLTMRARHKNNWTQEHAILLPSSIDVAFIPEIQVYYYYITEESELNRAREMKGLAPVSLCQISVPSILDHQLTPMGPTLRDTNLQYQKYPCVATAGTYDHLHDGHKVILTLSTLVSKHKVVVALLTATSNKKFSEFTEPLSRRCDKVQQFLSMINPHLNYEIERVNRCNDMAMCRLVNDTIVPAVIVENEPESITGINKVNAARVLRNLPALELVKKKSHRTVSSTDLREWLYIRSNKQ